MFMYMLGIMYMYLYVLQSSIAARDLTEVELLCHIYMFSIYTL